MNLFAIYDTKAEFYGQPFMARTHGDAIRSFTQAVNAGDSQLSKTPADYTLFCLAEYDDTTGEIKPHVHVHLGNGVQYVQSEQKGQ